MRVDPGISTTEEKFSSGFDLKIILRILKYVKPHALIFSFTLLSLTLSTAAFLTLPVLIQQGVDNHILPYYRGIDVDTSDPGLRELLGDIDTDLKIERMYYIKAGELKKIPGELKKRLVENKQLTVENYFVITDTADKQIAAILAAHPDLIRSQGDKAVISEKNFNSLETDEKKLLRKRDIKQINRLVLLYFIVLMAMYVFTFSELFNMAFVSQNVMKDMRKELFRHSLGFSLSYYTRTPSGKLISNITNDVETINKLFSTVISAILKDIFIMAGVFVVLFVLDPMLALWALIVLPPLVAATLIYRAKARDAYRKVRETISKLNVFLSEHLAGMSIVQIFAREKDTSGKFNKKNDEALKANYKEIMVFATFRPLIDLFATLSIALIIYAGAHFLIRDLITLGVLIAFINLLGKFFQPIQDLAEKFTILQSAMAGGERIFALMDIDETISEPEKPAAMDNTTGHIEFKNVSFAYKKNEPVLRNVSFTVSPGETVAIVGYTGAGKTTIASLLTRFWDVTDGEILVDSVNVKDIAKGRLRKNIQAVLQDVFIFSGTIEENIKLGKDISEEKINEVIKIVQADSFINKLTDGLQTKLHPGGTNLSMGQRQLLSFARFLAHDPAILILDEATAAIDTESEQLIQKAINNLLEDRTSIVIAHRLSTISHADKIIVLNKGKIEEAGTHSQLLEKEGLYFNLYKMQFAEG